MTDAEIAALKGAALKATPGGWRAAGLDVWTDGHRRVNLTTVAELHIAQVFDHHGDGFGGPADAAYIALANPDAILSLIARLKATEWDRDWYRRACEEADDMAPAATAAERAAIAKTKEG